MRSFNCMIEHLDKLLFLTATHSLDFFAINIDNVSWHWVNFGGLGSVVIVININLPEVQFGVERLIRIVNGFHLLAGRTPCCCEGDNNGFAVVHWTGARIIVVVQVAKLVVTTIILFGSFLKLLGQCFSRLDGCDFILKLTNLLRFCCFWGAVIHFNFIYSTVNRSNSCVWLFKWDGLHVHAAFIVSKRIFMCLRNASGFRLRDRDCT